MWLEVLAEEIDLWPYKIQILDERRCYAERRIWRDDQNTTDDAIMTELSSYVRYGENIKLLRSFGILFKRKKSFVWWRSWKV